MRIVAANVFLIREQRRVMSDDSGKRRAGAKELKKLPLRGSQFLITHRHRGGGSRQLLGLTACLGCALSRRRSLRKGSSCRLRGEKNKWSGDSAQRVNPNPIVHDCFPRVQEKLVFLPFCRHNERIGRVVNRVHRNFRNGRDKWRYDGSFQLVSPDMIPASAP